MGTLPTSRNLLASEGRVSGGSHAIVCFCPREGGLLTSGAPFLHTSECDFARKRQLVVLSAVSLQAFKPRPEMCSFSFNSEPVFSLPKLSRGQGSSH